MTRIKSHDLPTLIGTLQAIFWHKMAASATYFVAKKPRQAKTRLLSQLALAHFYMCSTLIFVRRRWLSHGLAKTQSLVALFRHAD